MSYSGTGFHGSKPVMGHILNSLSKPAIIYKAGRGIGFSGMHLALTSNVISIFHIIGVILSISTKFSYVKKTLICVLKNEFTQVI